MNSCDSGEHEGCFFLGGIMSSEWHKKLCVCIYIYIYMVLSNEDRREVHGFGK